MVPNMAVGRHGAGQVVESSTSGSIRNRKKEWSWALLEHLKPQNPPPVTHFLQQCHTYFSQVIPSNGATPSISCSLHFDKWWISVMLSCCCKKKQLRSWSYCCNDLQCRWPLQSEIYLYTLGIYPGNFRFLWILTSSWSLTTHQPFTH